MKKKVCGNCQYVLPENYANTFCPICGVMLKMDDDVKNPSDHSDARREDAPEELVQEEIAADHIAGSEEVVSGEDHDIPSEKIIKVQFEKDELAEDSVLSLLTENDEKVLSDQIVRESSTFKENRSLHHKMSEYTDNSAESDKANGNKSIHSGKIKIILIIAAALCVILCAVLFISGKTGSKGLSEFETVKFGSYEQDDNLDNGKEVIEWLVLDKNAENGQTLLLSKYALDTRPYHSDVESVTWGDCDLRKWLNEDEDGFFNSAFSDKEKSRIVTTKIQTGDVYGKEQEHTTEDRIFLLSTKEAKELLGNEQVQGVYPNRQVSATAYAESRGAWDDQYYMTADGKECCWWWMRSPGGSRCAAAVYGGGAVYGLVYNGKGAVRPAMWVNLES